MAAPSGTPTSYAPASLYAAHVSLSDGGKSSLMVLANLLLLYAALLVLGLQYLFYDLPTTSHVDEVFEKFILAIIETIMTMFMTGQGINGRFLLMFTSFLVGKWWALFGEGRVKRQEDHPLLVSTLLYARFSMAILLSLSFDICMIIYTAHAVQPALHPGLMRVFLFEFVNLATSSLSTATRLALCVIETVDVRRHTRLSQRKQRSELTTLTEATRSQSPRGIFWNQGEMSTNLPLAAGDRQTEETLQLWYEYRRWRTHVGLATDSIKIFTYLSYFAIYRASYGIPVQFVREIFLIVQARTKEVRDLIRLESTLRYIDKCSTDPAIEQIVDQDSCTICCEKMKQQENISNKKSASFASRWRVGIRAETCAKAEDRPKRLPCGHILHWGCLKRWFEIKSTCPVCRRTVKRINKAQEYIYSASYETF